MKILIPILTLLSLIIFISCAAHTNLEPKGKGNFSANFSIGGPIVKAFGTRIPVPYATTGFNYGLNDRIDLNGNLHLLSLFYKIFGFDFGTTLYPKLNAGNTPMIGIQPHLLTLFSLKSNVNERLRIYPIISNSFAWNYKKGLIYLGSDITIPFSLSDYDNDAAVAIFSPFLGYRWNLGKNLYLFTEIKFHGANVRSDQLAVEYVHIINHGAISTLFSLQRSF
jgi:hypothetical protein